MKKKKILITSALPYANGPIHLGHLLEVIQTDIFARFQRLAGNEAVYVCADDTHGTPIELNALKQGITPEELVKRVGTSHRQDFSEFGIYFYSYGSTNLQENQQLVNQVFYGLKTGVGNHIERRAIELTYCEHDQRFLPDRLVTGTCPRCGAAGQYGDVCESCKSTYNPTDLKDPRCALCNRTPTRKSSEHFFFKLDHFRQLLEDITAGRAEPEMDQQSRNYLQGWILQGLQDWCVSRDGPYFGFPIPGEENKFFYVWLDAPLGYISNTPLPWNSIWKQESEGEIWHFIGRDILYFHGLFWPAVLQASSYKRPHRIVVHGMLNVQGEKMLKSKGKLFTAREYLNVSGLHPEHLRYYFATHLTAEPQDIDFNVEDFRNRVNAELVNTIANFQHRTLSLLRSRFAGELVEPSQNDAFWMGAVEHLRAAVQHYEALDFAGAVGHIVKACNRGNEFVQERKPWASEPMEAHRDLSLCANLAYATAVLLSPVTPSMSANVLRQLGKSAPSLPELGLHKASQPWLRHGRVVEGDILMPRIDPKASVALTTTP